MLDQIGQDGIGKQETATGEAKAPIGAGEESICDVRIDGGAAVVAAGGGENVVENAVGKAFDEAQAEHELFAGASGVVKPLHVGDGRKGLVGEIVGEVGEVLPAEAADVAGG